MHKIIAIAVFAALAAAPARAQAIDSAYTKHDYQKCKVVGDEDPVLETLCQGYAGIPVRWLNEPDSSSIFFGDEPAPDDTYDARFTFAVVENTIEWRGPRKAGRIEPFATIVRFQLCRAIGGPCRPELVLFRLEGKRPFDPVPGAGYFLAELLVDVLAGAKKAHEARKATRQCLGEFLVFS